MIGSTAILFLIMLFCAIVALFLFHLRRLSMYRKAAKFPGPPTLPFVGNAHSFVGDSTHIFNGLVELMDSYSSPCTLWLGQRLFFLVYEPEQVEIVCMSPKTVEKDPLYQLAKPWLGHGLFTIPAGKWRNHRKLIGPTLNTKIVESFVEMFAKQSEIMTKRMSKELGGGDFDITNYVALCTLDFICETLMGVTVHAQSNKEHRYVQSARRAFQIMWQRLFNVFLYSDFIFSFTKLYRDQNECIKHLHAMTNDVIQEKRNASRRIECRSQNDCLDGRSTTKKIFLDYLMELTDEGIKFTDQELIGEVNTMMIAGSDTTGTANIFALFMLANYPEIQAKAYEELCEIYGDEISSERAIQSEDLGRMIYLERVIKETLRLFPFAPFIVREVREDIELADRIVPKGTSIALALMKLHRGEKNWPDPLKFDPDRFLPEEVAKRHPYSFAPFSAGPRMCLGSKYAMMAIKVLLATVLRRYVLIKDDIVAVEDIKLKTEIVLKPVTPMTLRIEKR